MSRVLSATRYLIIVPILGLHKPATVAGAVPQSAEAPAGDGE